VSATTTASRLVPELRAICGAEYVVEDPAELQRFRIGHKPPAVAVTPGSADEIAAILCFANEHGIPVLPAGGCTEQTAGLAHEAPIMLHTKRLTEVEHYDPADLTVGVGAGTMIATLCEMVGADQLLFALDPPLPQRSTVGGALATGIHGPMRHGYGTLRDFCIGIRFVTGDGRKAKGGGRVVKNVAGYDLMKLLIGSWGTLGIITSASFKLFPAPRQTRTFIAEFTSAKEALGFRDGILRSPLSPMCLELVSPRAIRLQSGAESPDAWLLCVRASGSDAVLARYRAELGSGATRELEGENECEWWQAIADFPPAREELRAAPLVVNWSLSTVSISVPLQEVGTVIERISSLVSPGWMTANMVGRVGTGHLLVSLTLEDVEAMGSAVSDVIDRLRNQLSRQASMVMRSGPHPRGFWPMTPTDIKSMLAVKQALDPRDILNRGRFPF